MTPLCIKLLHYLKDDDSHNQRECKEKNSLNTYHSDICTGILHSDNSCKNNDTDNIIYYRCTHYGSSNLCRNFSQFSERLNGYTYGSRGKDCSDKKSSHELNTSGSGKSVKAHIQNSSESKRYSNSRASKYCSLYT